MDLLFIFQDQKYRLKEMPVLQKFYGHLGIYGYKRSALEAMTTLPQTPLERTESLGTT